MIQFNLLPDVKIDYIKARRSKQMVIMIASAVSAAAIALLVVLVLVVFVFQGQHIKHLESDITSDSQKLQAIPDLNKILTIQNQLASLTSLHDKKPVTSRLTTYLGQVTPQDISIASLNVDFIAGTMTMGGSAPNLSIVNKFVDTLKFTDYSVEGQTDKRAFSQVVLAGFSRSDDEATYQLTFKFDPLIFDSKTDAKLKVPDTVTTRSETEKPSDLFQVTGSEGGQ